MIYLDYAANTKVDKEVLDLYYDVALNNYGNPNSNHKFGELSKKLIDDATNKIAKKKVANILVRSKWLPIIQSTNFNINMFIHG